MAVNIRRATASDVDNIRQLFYDTVTTVNRQHYNDEQVAAWSAGYHNRENWAGKVAAQHFIVAEEESALAGFASVTSEGYLDYMFVDRNRQGQGIASLLLSELETIAARLFLETLTTHASITAKPFFEKQGFEVVKQQTVQVRGAELTNFVMEKKLAFKSTSILPPV
ncbi:GNAT family N-acetyltransferase [Mucilaginibacter sp. PAMB04168]|uniref:GNAT family N-acetyltransferase n=1 Tax=Mucilaginibacter sp. PAMB04168 TaxID=3138567 RepID=UPI0031F61A37